MFHIHNLHSLDIEGADEEEAAAMPVTVKQVHLWEICIGRWPTLGACDGLSRIQVMSNTLDPSSKLLTSQRIVA